MGRAKVFLTGGDRTGWALDDDLTLTRAALETSVDLTDSLGRADVIHSVSWLGVAEIPEHLLLGKRIVCHVPGEPYRYTADPKFHAVAQRVGLWITQNHQAQAQMDALRLPNVQITYAADPTTFGPVAADARELQEFRSKWKIPHDKYLIGNFHRDSESADLAQPKLVKGPDVFAEIVAALTAQGREIHVVLAGPRRHWLRRRLTELGIPFTFVGRRIDDADDYHTNILSRYELNLLYNLLDLYLVTSRSEGGPRSILEAPLARCKIISTPVGLAPDVLPPDQLYAYPYLAVGMIAREMETGYLAAGRDALRQRVLDQHVPAALAPRFHTLYATIEQTPVWEGVTDEARAGGDEAIRAIKRRPRSWRAEVRYRLKHNPVTFSIWRRLIQPRTQARRRAPAGSMADGKTPELTVSLWHKFVAGPYGGGNQFMQALRKGLVQANVRVVENELGPEVDAHIVNSVQFDLDTFVNLYRMQKLTIVHRIDGPIALHRNGDRSFDDLCFQFNRNFASATIIQSHWTYGRLIEMGYRPVRPVVIHNAVDPDIFHARGRIPFDPGRKVRLISTSWSPNVRKGGPVYKWIEEHLDWGRFEYTFVGRASERFDCIRTLEPVASEELAEVLRQHDIYITASQGDSCPNSLIEAQACGLPALYLEDGGHPELVGFGGLPFTTDEEILPQLDRLVENYSMFQRLITVPSLDEIAGKYLVVLRDAAGGAGEVMA